MNCILRMKDIWKSYPGVQVLKGISFDLCEGEIHALVGENGAGKSTLIKILGGAVSPEKGALFIFDRDVVWKGPMDAIEAGIGVIHQELSLAPHLSVYQNIFMGRELRKGPFSDHRAMKKRSSEILESLGVYIDPDSPVQNLSTGEQQMVEIARVMAQNVRIVAMDEPTSSLSKGETERLFEVVRSLKSRGVGVIYISHRLQEVFSLSDRISILRDGEIVESRATSELTEEEVISHMVGRSVSSLYPRSFRTAGSEILRVDRLSRRGFLKEISFSLKRGEILGFAGLVGSGRSEVARCLFGLDPFDSGEILLDGKTYVPGSSGDALSRNVVLLPEDRKLKGLFINRSIRDNIASHKIHNGLRRGIFMDRASEEKLAFKYIEDLSIKCRSMMDPVESLSGGNQQKVVLARGLAVNPKIFILDEPTRGIDVGARAEIHRLIDELASVGMAVILISSDLPEVLGMSDRIAVMRDGSLEAILSHEDAKAEKVMAIAAGGGF